MPGTWTDQPPGKRSGTVERTGAVVALKPLPQAKTRFAGIDPQLRQRLAWAMALDTLEAVSRATDVVVLVTAEPSAVARLAQVGLAVRVLSDPGRADDPLNSAFAAGIQSLATDGCTLVACVMADLPALNAATLTAIMNAAGAADRPVLVGDADGIGSTMIVGRPDRLRPRFGGHSADRHRGHGIDDVQITDEELGGARVDVDDQLGLSRAHAVGLGTHTGRLVHDTKILPRQAIQSTAACR